MKVLLLENIHDTAVDNLTRLGYDVERLATSLPEDDLIEALDGVSVLGLRSNTNLTAKVIANAPDLIAVGAFCIGTNQIDLEAAAQRGIAAFNAPYSNTRSVVELVIAEIISLARRLPEKSDRMHAGVWDKSAKGSHEVRGRVLGIIGYGNIGSQLSVVAEALGMQVLYYDTADRLAYGDARKVGSMDELLERADVVSLHVDGRPGNAGLFGAEQFASMKPRSMFINASRGMVVDDQALREHILSGHLAGAALDVFPVEPKAQGDEFVSPLLGLDNVILTPHVGGSTQEAQEEIGGFVSNKLAAYIGTGNTALSVNLPEVAVDADGSTKVAHLHENEPGILREITNLLGESGANVCNQALHTRGQLGYVVTSLEGQVPDVIAARLSALPHTISSRVIPGTA